MRYLKISVSKRYVTELYVAVDGLSEDDLRSSAGLAELSAIADSTTDERDWEPHPSGAVEILSIEETTQQESERFDLGRLTGLYAVGRYAEPPTGPTVSRDSITVEQRGVSSMEAWSMARRIGRTGCVLPPGYLV